MCAARHPALWRLVRAASSSAEGPPPIGFETHAHARAHMRRARRWSRHLGEMSVDKLARHFRLRDDTRFHLRDENRNRIVCHDPVEYCDCILQLLVPTSGRKNLLLIQDLMLAYPRTIPAIRAELGDRIRERVEFVAEVRPDRLYMIENLRRILDDEPLVFYHGPILGAPFLTSLEKEHLFTRHFLRGMFSTRGAAAKEVNAFWPEQYVWSTRGKKQRHLSVRTHLNEATHSPALRLALGSSMLVGRVWSSAHAHVGHGHLVCIGARIFDSAESPRLRVHQFYLFNNQFIPMARIQEFFSDANNANASEAAFIDWIGTFSLSVGSPLARGHRVEGFRPHDSLLDAHKLLYQPFELDKLLPRPTPEMKILRSSPPLTLDELDNICLVDFVGDVNNAYGGHSPTHNAILFEEVSNANDQSDASALQESEAKRFIVHLLEPPSRSATILPINHPLDEQVSPEDEDGSTSSNVAEAA
eukprot:m.75961 g.75961  ORF g.75961 m.75961 type:complete len:473 (-) comp8100_c2_seq1:187-1605(-)